MLILSRKLGESIVIDGRIVVKIMRVDGDLVKLGIEAPVEVPVHRHEVYVEIQENNEKAMTTIKVKLPQLAAPLVSHRVASCKTAHVNTAACAVEFDSEMVLPSPRK
jgi:carbon storage regulator